MNQASQPSSGWLSASTPKHSAEAVRAAVDRVAASRVFSDSQRMARFLRFAVEETLQGNGARLKEIVIGAEVFDRGADYDPRLDPIVRVEARRLRAKLLTYYEGEGKNDELIIEFPKGTYQPVFQARTPSTLVQAEAHAPTTRAVAADPSTIAILPFTNLDPEADQKYFSDGLTEELIHALTRIPELRVIAWNTASHFRANEDVGNIRSKLGVAYVLRGAIRRTGQRLRVTAQLIDTATGQYLWSETYNREVLDVFTIQEQIATVIVSALQLRLGDASRIEHNGQPQRSLECYNLCLKGRYHANERTPDGLKRAAICYQQAVAVDGSSALAYAGLADSNYNALIGKLERRFSNGLSLLTSYTWGHSLDNGANSNDQSDPAPQNSRDLAAQRGNSNFDIKHRFVVSSLYALPFNHTHGIVGAIAHGWQINGIFAAQTGLPFTVVNNTDQTVTGVTARPNRLRDGSLSSDQQSIYHWFDLTAFATPTCACYGNSGRGILRGPGSVNLDFSVMRNFVFHERYRLQFRAESFNIANHPNFGLPAYTLGNAPAGTITSVSNPERQLQMAMKLYF